MRSPFLMTVALLSTIGLVACGPYTLTPVERMAAETGARSVAERTQATFVSCSAQDSDNDGYVTCSTTKNELACAYKVDKNTGNVATGCKRK